MPSHLSFPLEVSIPSRNGQPAGSVNLMAGITMIVGPNGSGKTQILRAIKDYIRSLGAPRAVRYVSAGRLAPLEQYRSNYDGHRMDSSQILYDSMQLGSEGEKQRRHSIETIVGDFHTLSARPDLQVKVGERLSRLFGREIVLEWDKGILKPRFCTPSVGDTYYPASREASGLLQLVCLLSAIYDDEIGVLLIDEPEVSLHPQLQSFLFREMQSVAGDPIDPQKKLIILATHSTEMLEIRELLDLQNIVFCSEPGSPPSQVSPLAPELSNRRLQGLVARIGQEHKLAFFCRRPFLVEGPSDAIICRGLDRRLGLYLEAAGSQIVPVVGKGEIPTVVKLFRLLGKNPLALADLDYLADGTKLINAFLNNEEANTAASHLGHPSAVEFAGRVYSDFSSLLESNRDRLGSMIEGLQVSQIDDETKRKVLAWLLQAKSEGSIGASWWNLKTRFLALLKLLQSQGCFILTKGSIEAYFQNAEAQAEGTKPQAAVMEVESFCDFSENYLTQTYSDIVTALEMASSCEPIDEVRAIREILLAVAAPAVAALDSAASSDSLGRIAARIVGEKASLFGIRVVDGNSGSLEIAMKSRILPTEKFPLVLRRGCNLISEVDRQLGID